jgi:hypothetical protein
MATVQEAIPARDLGRIRKLACARAMAGRWRASTKDRYEFTPYLERKNLLQEE